MGGAIENVVVVAGLDPAIRPSSQDFLTEAMDPRVKPGGDGWDSEMLP